MVPIDRTSSALCDLVEGLPDSAWSMLAESPAGHVSVAAVVQHALWDAWVHERDVVIPLGLAPVEEDDEVLASLQYAAAVNAGFGLMAGIAVPATLLLEVTDPDARIAVTVDDTVHTTAVAGDVPPDAVVLAGRAVDLTEMLSTRVPLDQPVPADKRWLVSSLAEMFEVA